MSSKWKGTPKVRLGRLPKDVAVKMYSELSARVAGVAKIRWLSTTGTAEKTATAAVRPGTATHVRP
jgi:hypothetical protein